MQQKQLIYIIEDTEEIATLISIYLEKANFLSKIFFTAEEALEEIKQGNIPDFFLLDLNLPGISGFEFLKEIKEVTHRSIPTLIISARDTDEDIIKGLELGADDFVVKPFSPRVLVAKIEACLRRVAKTTAAAEETLTFGDYTILINSNILKKGNVKIQLSSKEYAVLEYLARHPNTPISPEQIYTDVWKAKYGDITAVAVYIQRLRKKIENDPANPDFIKTEFGLGYKFITGK